MKSNLCSGTLCMDVCVYNEIELDGCLTSSNEKASSYRVSTFFFFY